MKNNYIISFPSSGNHLTRFFIELLSERPTAGTSNMLDIELYRNIYSEPIPFNIPTGSTNYIYYKDHSPIHYNKLDRLIFIVRNPKEILVKNSLYEYNVKYFNSYFKLIDFYNKYDGPKILFYYEDILSNKTTFIKNLYAFINVDNLNKLEYCLQNVNKLFDLSLHGTNRAWGGNNSSGNVNIYWDKSSEDLKNKMNIYLNEKKHTNKYTDIFNYYNI